MPTPRKQLISLDSTPYYHCVSRCVRRAFLCGTDSVTGESYEHRRGWLEQQLLALPKVFAIEVAAYAIMSNHYHVVLHVNPEAARGWCDKQVVERWHILFKGNVLSQKFLASEELGDAERARLNICIQEWRSRLCNISWFMRVLNEKIAREANQEDGCTGRFWEGRFKSQALLDEASLAACMAYVDLNPVRANMAKTPEESEHTSIKARIEHAQTQTNPDTIMAQVPSLLGFVGNSKQNITVGILMCLSNYLSLVDYTGRCIRDNKKGCIPEQADEILTRLGLDQERWIDMTQKFGKKFGALVGREESVRNAYAELNYRRAPRIKDCKVAFG